MTRHQPVLYYTTWTTFVDYGLSEVNRMIRFVCGYDGIPGQVTCPGVPNPTRTPMTTSSRFTSSTTSLGTALPTPGLDAESSSQGSSGTSTSGSSGRRGSKTGIKAGIAVGVIAAILLILGILYFIIGRRKFDKMQKEKEAQNRTEGIAGGLASQPSTTSTRQELDDTENPIIASTHTMVNNGDQAQANVPMYVEMPTTQRVPPHQEHSHVESGARWGEGPMATRDSPAAGQ